MVLFRYYPDDLDTIDKELDKKILIHSLIFPGIFVLAFWFVKIVEVVFGFELYTFGIFPLHLKGLPGIIFSPFLHSGFGHLMANTVPFFILLAALVYFYRKYSYRIFFQIYLLSGICVWLGGREAWHIGASGVVYGLAAFHFVSGILRNDIRLLTVSVIVVFLYGGMFWGIFPLKPDISWESHLWGATSGVVLAIYYRKYGIRKKKFSWEDEPDEEEESDVNTGPNLIPELDSDPPNADGRDTRKV
jgi:membrane associated rhomboid family serine protease